MLLLAAYLDAHPTGAAAELTARLKELHTGLAGEALELRPGDFLVTAHIFETGTFFIVGRSDDGAARVKWSIDRFAASPAADRKLRCWHVCSSRRRLRASRASMSMPTMRATG